MKPEEKAEIILWDWLKTKGITIEDVFFNRKNQLNGVFSVTGEERKKPDFLIKINRGFGTELIIVEVKSCKSSRDVHDSGKILMYYENYILGKTKYIINDEEVKINHFAVATENSPKGHLFKTDDEQLKNLSSDDEWRKSNAKLNLIPEVEYIRTSDFQRRLWSEWRSLKKRLNIDFANMPSIGIIISNPTKDTNPYLFIMTYCNWLNKKSRWSQRFWRL